MAKQRGPWNEGRKAWDRLSDWHQEHSPNPGEGNAALTALADIGLIRHLVDQTELVAVRAARRHGKSWAEIATQLGVTRQSAWERWRDLDDSPPSADIAAAVVGEVVADAPALRRRANVTVPNVVGLNWDEARNVLLAKGLVAVGPDPDGLPLAALGWPDGVVTDQVPESGAKVPSGAAITLYIGRGGGTGVREPRRPSPGPRPLRAMHAEPSDEAVG